MIAQRTFRKFEPQQEKIAELEKSSPRFKRIYTEYEIMSDELWNLENTDIQNIPDDFLEAVKIQTACLEEEIHEWLLVDSSICG